MATIHIEIQRYFKEFFFPMQSQKLASSIYNIKVYVKLSYTQGYHAKFKTEAI